MNKVVISSIGKDQPGIVGAFTEILYQNNCNIEDASMTILGNQFTMILIIDVPKEIAVEVLQKKFQPAEDKFKLTINVSILENGEKADIRTVDFKPYMFTVSGLDKTGIAFNISNILAKYQVNITDFSSKIIGTQQKPVYIMMIETQVPDNADIEAIKSEVKETTDKLGLDFNLKEIECCEL